MTGDEVDRRYLEPVQTAKQNAERASILAKGLAATADEFEWLAAQEVVHNPVDPDGPVVPALADPGAMRAAAETVRQVARVVLADGGGWALLQDELESSRDWESQLDGPL